ncbi:MAG: hypothetical protein ACRDIB_12150, partial [Ardenticatenaceae bacterium]
MARPFDLITFDFDGVLLHNNYNALFLDGCRTFGLTWPEECEVKLARFVHDYYGSGHARADLETHGQERFWSVATWRFLDMLAAEGNLETAATAITEHLQKAELIYHH